MTFPPPDSHQVRHVLYGNRFIPVRRRWGIAKNNCPTPFYTYTGPTWRSAGLIQPARGSFFSSEQTAREWARVLTYYNGVGFHVFEFQEGRMSDS